MPTVKERIDAIRERRPFVDHVMRMVEHFGAVKGNLQAGAVTYFGYLSFFPILAIGFAVVGFVAQAVPEAQDALVGAIQQVLPGMVSEQERPGKLAISTIQAAAPGIVSVGLPVMLYSGLGWLSAMREALLVVFEKPQREQPNFVVGKAKDLVALVVLGLVLILSVGISGALANLAAPVVEFFHLGPALEPLVIAIAVLFGLLAYAVLFFAFFALLGDPDEPRSALWQGAALGAVGFQLLTQLSSYLISSTAGQPAFQAFGISLILVVWINYFSRVVMYAAAWAHTAPAARTARELAELHGDRTEEHMRELAEVPLRETPARRRSLSPRTSFAAGGASMLGLVALLRKRKEK